MLEQKLLETESVIKKYRNFGHPKNPLPQKSQAQYLRVPDYQVQQEVGKILRTYESRARTNSSRLIYQSEWTRCLRFHRVNLTEIQKINESCYQALRAIRR